MEIIAVSDDLAYLINLATKLIFKTLKFDITRGYKRIRPNDPLIGEECSICCEEYTVNEYKRTLDDCDHTFHKRCCDKWIRVNMTCPICRTDYTLSQF